MPTITETAEIETDVDTLWKDVGDFRAVSHWHPLVTALNVQGEGIGSVRTANPGTPQEQFERLRSVDMHRHCYRYALERSSLPVRDYVGEFRIEAAADNRSRVVWSAQFELATGADDKTADAVRRFLRAGTEHLKARYRPWIHGESRVIQRELADVDRKARTGSETEPLRNTPPAGAWNDTSSN
jgi:hypothetical protein